MIRVIGVSDFEHIVFAAIADDIGSTPNITQPSPIKIEDLTGWTEYPNDEQAHPAAFSPFGRDHYTVSKIELTKLIEDAEFAAVHLDEKGMTATLEKIAENIEAILTVETDRK